MVADRAGRAVGLLGMLVFAVVPPAPLWRDRILLQVGYIVFRWVLRQICYSYFQDPSTQRCS